MESKIRTLPQEHGNISSSLDYFLKFDIPKNAKILDVGCGWSLAYNIFLKGYKNIEGIDVDKERIKKGKKNYPNFSKKIKYYSGKKIPFSDNSFDVVLMFDVIEHIPNVEKFLKEEVYRVLKKGGIFIFQTPNKWINIPWEIINKKSFTKWKEYHCSLQTKRSLYHLLRKSGFKDIIIEKGNILTEHNKSKVRKKLGPLGLILLYFLSILPLSLNPNLWESGRR